ncbi:hypothetical protein DE146DRAFT_652984 [Phaeosphaeria sp. MPI-PUGE-AT-0046c]|nr:hypothetical protein DE146DRAFT_652984 [Phaeosphaeria sp. MPI-PUGE-AT-0046c]
MCLVAAVARAGAVMLMLPPELWLLVLEQSSLEELAVLRRTSRYWRYTIDAHIVHRLRRLPVGEEFAAAFHVGLLFSHQHWHGRTFPRVSVDSYSRLWRQTEIAGLIAVF